MNRPIQLTENDIARFWSHVNKEGQLWTNPETGEQSRCWEWTGALTEGYGMFGIGHDSFGTHRVSYTIHKGNLPDGLLACHKCDNRKCVNDSHLFAGTKQDNYDDMQTKGRRALNRGEKNGKHTHLTGCDVTEMRRLLSLGVTGEIVKQMFLVSSSTVHRIKTRFVWSHVP